MVFDLPLFVDGDRGFSRNGFGEERRLLYVATPGIRNYLEYGGHGLLVFDIDRWPQVRQADSDRRRGHETAQPLNVKGICASAEDRLDPYQHDHDADVCRSGHRKVAVGTRIRQGLRPDGPVSRRDGSSISRRWSRTSGTFSMRPPAMRSPASRPTRGPTTRSMVLTANGAIWQGWGRQSAVGGGHARATQSRSRSGRSPATSGRSRSTASRRWRSVCVNECLGFEVGDLTTGKMLHRVEVPGYPNGARSNATAARPTASA